MVNPAAEIITTRLKEAEKENQEAITSQAEARQELRDWVTGFCEEYEKEPTKKDM